MAFCREKNQKLLFKVDSIIYIRFGSITLLLYLCHDDSFSFPPKRAIQSSLGDFFVSYAKIQNLYDAGNQIARFV